MSDSAIDQKQCDHCGGEIPKVSANCPLCGEAQEFGTNNTPTEDPESELTQDVMVATSSGTEISWSDVKDTKTAWRLELVYTFLGLGAYLGTASVIVIALHGVYRVAIGSGMFLTSILWMGIAFAVVVVLGGLNELLRQLSPTYRLVTKIEE